MDISIIGGGYVGVITGVGLAKLKNKAICMDIDKERIHKLNSKEEPFYEKGLKELLNEVVPDYLTATTDLKSAILNSDITFICVGTPSRKHGEIKLEQIRLVSEDIGKILEDKDRFHVIVVKSTVVPETLEKTVIPVIEEFSGKKFGKDFGVCMNPEFLKEGSALDDFFKPDRIVIGSSDQKSINTLKELYKDFTCPILETSFREAEMIKYAANALLATKISFINEIGNICKKLDINTNIVAEGVGLDYRISPYFLKSGIGFGGSCFPKDVSALVYKATEQGYYPRLLRSVLDVNKEQPLRLLGLLENINLKHKKIAILGLTFKADTDDVRESPSLFIIKELLMEQVELLIYDPMGMPAVMQLFPHLNFTHNAQEAINKADIVLLLTDWPQFRELDYGDKMVIDGKNIFDGKRPKNYHGICW